MSVIDIASRQRVDTLAHQHEACRALLLLGGRFTDERYAWCFHAMTLLVLADKEVNLITLAEQLRQIGKWHLTGAEFIEELAGGFEG